MNCRDDLYVVQMNNGTGTERASHSSRFLVPKLYLGTHPPLLGSCTSCISNLSYPMPHLRPPTFTRFPLLLVALLVSTAPCNAGKPGVRDGSTKAKAIPLAQHEPAKAVDEEMAWMMKLHHYTPILATRDLFADIIRQFKAGKTKAMHPPDPWGHATVEHNGRWLSDWWFRTPRGRKTEIYFDTGASVTTPGEVPRQESARAQYMGQRLKSLKAMGL
jgi:hypothetical protein